MGDAASRLAGALRARSLAPLNALSRVRKGLALDRSNDGPALPTVGRLVHHADIVGERGVRAHWAVRRDHFAWHASPRTRETKTSDAAAEHGQSGIRCDLFRGLFDGVIEHAVEPARCE